MSDTAPQTAATTPSPTKPHTDVTLCGTTVAVYGLGAGWLLKFCLRNPKAVKLIATKGTGALFDKGFDFVDELAMKLARKEGEDGEAFIRDVLDEADFAEYAAFFATGIDLTTKERGFGPFFQDFLPVLRSGGGPNNGTKWEAFVTAKIAMAMGVLTKMEQAAEDDLVASMADHAGTLLAKAKDAVNEPVSEPVDEPETSPASSTDATSGSGSTTESSSSNAPGSPSTTSST